MELIEKTISKKELEKMALRMFGTLVKAVVDVEQDLLVIDAELHADQERYLLDLGSKQENLWGINIYPDRKGEDMVEFDSMINLRPAFGNSGRGVEDVEIQKKILEIVKSRIVE